MTSKYDVTLYADDAQIVRTSARQIVPVLVSWFSPKAVLDVGCGDGAWLKVFGQHGVEQMLGIDNASGTLESLQISSSFLLEKDLAVPIELGLKFDLVLCLEVAEHLPVESGPVLIDTLVLHGDIIVFSAAVPMQPGGGHVNCRWPEYWSALFEARGFRRFDVLRSRVWDNSDVAWWYSQNMFLYVSDVALERLAGRVDLERIEDEARPPVRMIHPDSWMETAKSARMSAGKRIAGGLARRISKILRNRNRDRRG